MLFFKSVSEMNLADSIKMVITTILNSIAMGMIPNTTFLLFLLFSDTSFDMAMGSDRVQIVIKSPYVGIINMYRPIPSTPIILVVTILIIMLKIFVIRPPIIRISVDFINFSFIVKDMCVGVKN